MNVSFDRDGSVGYVTLNRPEKRNALNSEMLIQLMEVLSDVSRDDSIKVVILRGSGGNFCSGHDLSELLKDPMDVKDISSFVARLCMLLGDYHNQ